MKFAMNVYHQSISPEFDTQQNLRIVNEVLGHWTLTFSLCLLQFQVHVNSAKRELKLHLKSYNDGCIMHSCGALVYSFSLDHSQSGN